MKFRVIQNTKNASKIGCFKYLHGHKLKKHCSNMDFSSKSKPK